MLDEIDLTNPGRMISASKSGYMSENRDHLVAFNGGIYTKSKGHVWSGDMDVTVDTPRLKEIAGELGETVYIFREKVYDRIEAGETIPWDEAIAVIEA